MSGCRGGLNVRRPWQVSTALAALALLVLSAAPAHSQAAASRRLTTLDAIRQFPGFYHLQNVLLRGELVENGAQIMLRADEHEMRVLLGDGARNASGDVEVRGQVIDVGRLEPDDPRAAGVADGRTADRWPRPGEEIVVRLSAVADAQASTTPSVRAIALEPWKFEGQTVTLGGVFRGRNLFGDLSDAPAKSRYDFVLRGAEGALWVTGLRPRGKGFDLDIDRRLDTGRWLEVTGTVARDRGLVRVEATQIVLGKAPAAAETEEEAAPPVAREPGEVVFSSPSDGETDVSGATTIRIQFSRGIDEASLAGALRVTYAGSPDTTSGGAPPGLEFKTSYDAASRAIEIRFARPLEPFRTVRVATLEGLKTFDGAPVRPWSVSFSIAQ